MLIRVSNTHTHTNAHACAHTQHRQSGLALGEHLIQKKLQRGGAPRDPGPGARTLPRTLSLTNTLSMSLAGSRAQRAQARGAKQVRTSVKRDPEIHLFMSKRDATNTKKEPH